MLKMNSLVSTLIDSILDITNFKVYFKVLLLTSMRRNIFFLFFYYLFY